MASVHKRPESKYWHAAWRTTDGQLRLRSTKKTNRTEALGIAVDWERIDKKIANGEMAESQVRKVVNDILERAGHSALEAPYSQMVLEWFRKRNPVNLLARPNDINMSLMPSSPI